MEDWAKPVLWKPDQIDRPCQLVRNLLAIDSQLVRNFDCGQVNLPLVIQQNKPEESIAIYINTRMYTNQMNISLLNTTRCS